MKFVFFLSILITTFGLLAQQLPSNHPSVDSTEIESQNSAEMPKTTLGAEAELEAFIAIAKAIDTSEIERAATQQNGRIKPLHTLARESILFLMGRYQKWGLSSTQIYLGLMADPNSGELELLEVRNLELRQKLGFMKSKKYYSFNQLDASPLGEMVNPLFKRQEQNSKSLSEEEKQTLETYHQMSILKNIMIGEHFFLAVDFSLFKSTNQQHSPLDELQKTYGLFFNSLKSGNKEELLLTSKALVQFSKTQETPDLYKHFVKSLDSEILYNKLGLFFWAFVASLILGILFIVNAKKEFLKKQIGVALYFIPLVLMVIGLSMRVYITEFAPVTNMYGTMIWVALGIMIFNFILFFLYQNYTLAGSMLLGSGVVLWITESIPLVLNPDLDPIVAVLRNNFWLSTHVTTITISYAALTMAMILGNIALIRTWIFKDNKAFFKDYAHYTYRLIQLGTFLLTVGIILGGVWADYSWGRFWGWDPKETWALIADLGFLAILHAKYVGWVKDFKLLIWAPVAYLLVIMAWYGVNFILASGLHSYGFSSGGAYAIAIFVIVQLALIFATLLKIKLAEKLNS